jgi:ATP-binding cassette subfamily C (CFTR/MRP) protein 1
VSDEAYFDVYDDTRLFGPRPPLRMASKSLRDSRSGVAAADSTSVYKVFRTNLAALWSTLLFTWIVPLLELGNTRPLEQSDLFPLAHEDQGRSVYARFMRVWRQQLKQATPSLAVAFITAFGYPFMVAGGLKLVHDSCLFVGPQLLNRIILFLNDPSQPKSVGLTYVAMLFLANLTMSICLRQYFW